MHKASFDTDSFNGFTPGFVPVVMQPPEKSRPRSDFDQAVEANPTKDTEPAINPATREIEPNHQEAYAWFKRAAEQNFGPAQFNLGIMCGDTKNYAAAYVWLYLAEQNGVEHAKENREKAAAFLGEDDLNAARLSISTWLMDFGNRT